VIRLFYRALRARHVVHLPKCFYGGMFSWGLKAWGLLDGTGVTSVAD
jgi:hypothetical protein